MSSKEGPRGDLEEFTEDPYATALAATRTTTENACAIALLDSSLGESRRALAFALHLM